MNITVQMCFFMYNCTYIDLDKTSKHSLLNCFSKIINSRNNNCQLPILRYGHNFGYMVNLDDIFKKIKSQELKRISLSRVYCTCRGCRVEWLSRNGQVWTERKKTATTSRSFSAQVDKLPVPGPN